MRSVDRAFGTVLTRRPHRRTVPAWAAVGALVAVLATGCTGTGTSPSAASAGPTAGTNAPSGAPTPAASTADQTVATTRTVCFREDAPELATAAGKPVATGLEFFPMATLHGTVYGRFITAHTSGVGSYDPGTGTFVRIASYGPQASGAIWMAAGGNWVVWLEGTSATNPGLWTMPLWNTRTAQLTELESSQTPGVGTPASAPVIDGTTLIWEEMAGDKANPITDLRAHDLATGTTRLIARGQLGPPARVGGLIVWSTAVKGPTGTTYQLRAVSATTFQPAPPPVALDQPTMVGGLVGTADELGMSDSQGQTYRVYSATGQLTAALELPGAHNQTPSSGHAFQYVQLQGNHIIWDSPTGTILANLDTGVAAVLPEFSAAHFVGTSVAVSMPQTPPASKSDLVTSVLSVIPWPIPETAHC